jgi:hypothetical protein
MDAILRNEEGAINGEFVYPPLVRSVPARATMICSCSRPVWKDQEGDLDAKVWEHMALDSLNLSFICIACSTRGLSGVPRSPSWPNSARSLRSIGTDTLPMRPTSLCCG